MKNKWSWDSKRTDEEIRIILKNPDDNRFFLYITKLLARSTELKYVFSYIDKITFCRQWNAIKKRMSKDKWVIDKIIYWQSIYEIIHEGLKAKGIKIKTRQLPKKTKELVNIGNMIKTIRGKKGMSQGALAKKMGIIQQYISSIETGRDNISICVLYKIARALDAKLDITLK